VSKGAGGTVHHTNGFVYNGIATAELDNVARAVPPDGTPGGSTDGTWQTIDLDVTFPAGRTTTTLYAQHDHHGGGDGPVAYIDSITATGPGLGLAPWRKSGTLTTFEQSTAQVDSGTYSAKILTSGQFEGIDQPVTGLVVGRTHTFRAKIYHAAGANRDFRLRILRGDGGTAIATNTVAIPTGTWTEISVSGVVDVADAVVEIHYADAAAAMDWWVDSTQFKGGMASDSWGGIFQTLMDDATVDHTAETPPLDRNVLGFLDYSSFTGALDSNGDSWSPATVEYRANRGKKYSQVAADASNQGTEWEVKETATPGSFELNLYNPYDFDTFVGGVGQDLSSADFPVIMVGNGVIAGPTVTEPAGGNVMVVEGAGGVWDLVKDTTAIGNYDRRELYAGDENLLGLSTVTETAQQLLDEQLKPPKPLKVVMRTFGDDTTGRVVPWRDFGVGDRVKVHIPPKYIQAVKRVVEITTDFRPDEATHTVEFETRTYTSDPVKGTIEAVRRLLDKFDRLEDPGTAGETTVIVDPETDKPGYSIRVAASDARQESISAADFVCDGVDDQEEIQAAIALLHTAGGGRLLLSEGTFVCAAQLSLPSGSDIEIVGMGMEATLITFENDSGSSWTQAFHAHSSNHTSIRDLSMSALFASANNISYVLDAGGTTGLDLHSLKLDNKALTATGGALRVQSKGLVEDILVPVGNLGSGIEVTGDTVTLVGCRVEQGQDVSNGEYAFLVSGDHCTFTGCKAEFNGDGSGDDQGGIQDNGQWNTYTNCEIIGDSGASPTFPLKGIYFTGASGPAYSTVTGCRIAAEGACVVIAADDVEIIGNSLERATGGNVVGIEVQTTASRVVIDSNLIDTTVGTGHGISIEGAADDILVSGNIIRSGDDGIHVSTTATKVMLHNNHVVSATNDGLHVESGGDVTVHGNDFSGASTAINGTVTDLHGVGGASDELIEETQVFSSQGNLSVTTGTTRLVFAYAATIVDVRAVVDTQPTGAAVIVDVNKNGTTIFTTQANRPTIAVSTNDSGLATPDVTSFAAGDYMQVDIDQIGSTIAGADLTVMVRFRRV
jgi:hypothetical protein